LLANIPGYRYRLPTDPDRCTEDHHVCDAVFDRLPWDRYTVLKLHATASQANLAVLERYRLPAVVMYRDFRDECISRYFVVLNDSRHRHHRYYNSVPKPVGLAHCIEVTLEEFVPWVREWLPIVQSCPEQFLPVRFEELRPDPRAAFERVLKFYGFQMRERDIARIVAKTAARTRFDLKANLRDGRPTVRKGIVGDWKNHFTPEHVERFKEGCGRFLIELGYERDLQWGAQSAEVQSVA